VLQLTDILDNHPDVTRKLRALWALHVIGGLDDKRVAALLNSDEEYVRAWAVQLLLEDGTVSLPILQKLSSMAITEPSAVVRLYLASALQQLPLESRWELAAALMEHGEDAGDHNLPLMIWYGIEPLVTEKPQLAMSIALATKIPLLTRYIVRRAAVDPAATFYLLAALGAEENNERQLMMLEEIRQVLESRAKMKMPKSWPNVYKKLSQSKIAAVREHAQFITVKFGDKSIFPALREIVADNKAADSSRTQALSALLDGRDTELPALMHRLLDDGKLRGPALRGLARFDHRDTPQQILSRYKTYNANERGDAVLTLASRKTYAIELLDAMKAGTVPRGDMSAFTVRQLQRFDDKELLTKLNDVWGQIRSTSAEKQKRIAGFKKTLSPAVLASADLPHGRELFKQTCAKCHKLFGDGGKIGPDITGSNRRNLDYLLENMLDPSAVVGRDFLMTTVSTKGGRVLSGLIVQENESALTLQTVNEKVVIALDEIDFRKKSKISMMPEGQLDKLKPNDIRDLVAYLGSPSQVPLPGELPPLDVNTGRVAGAMEGEAMKIVGTSAGSARSQKMREYGNNKWSGADHLWWTGGKPGDKLTLEIAVPTAGEYELYAAMTKARDYGIVQLLLDGKKIGSPVDLYNTPAVIPTGPVSFGTHELTAGKHRLTIEIVGANPKAVKAYMFGLDYVFAARQTKK
jgi:putative heme-binding domain-containing protein